jgi:bifunctional ADP-heptose synthase (sugar kinase/adenylyltransferase)
MCWSRDLMLDFCRWDDLEHISLEAPAVILNADQREETLGCAGNVATRSLVRIAKLLEFTARTGVTRRTEHLPMSLINKAF